LPLPPEWAMNCEDAAKFDEASVAGRPPAGAFSIVFFFGSPRRPTAAAPAMAASWKMRMPLHRDAGNHAMGAASATAQAIDVAVEGTPPAVRAALKKVVARVIPLKHPALATAATAWALPLDSWARWATHSWAGLSKVQ